MIGWLNEINRLASKGKREHRELPVPPSRPQGSPAPPAQHPGPIPGHRAAPDLHRVAREFKKKKTWESSSMGEIFSDLIFGLERASGTTQGGRDQAPALHLETLHTRILHAPKKGPGPSFQTPLPD